MPFKKLHSSIQTALDICKYTEATPIQAKALPEIMAGKDVVACAQTGSGKTAAFVLPALHALASKKNTGKPTVLILTPTRELATQITTASRKYGSQVRFNIVSLVGGMPYEPQIRDLKRGADIIVATPGRLIDHLENHRVDLSGIEILVLDEADRMLDMGFIEDIEIIVSKTPEQRQTLLFSATLDKSIIQIVKRLLNEPVMIDLSKEKISTPKIKQTVIKAKNMHHKSRMLKHFLNDENIFKAIIFSATKTNADKLAGELRAEGFAAAPLHGDLRQNVRNRTIEAFRQGKIQFLIATDVAARGLDINDITHVINYDLPKFCEDYVHRIGRTGRAGKTGEAISFCSATDLRNLQRIERYIGQRLPVQHDELKYADASGNTRSDAAQFPPEDMMPAAKHGRGGKRRFNDSSERFDRSRKRFDRDDARPSKPAFGEKRSFGGDKPESFDRPRKRFDRDEPRAAKSFTEKKSFGGDKPESFDRPRKRFDRDEQPRAAKPFGEKRSFGKDKPESFDRPRKRSDRDEPRATKSFGEKRSFSNDRSESSDRPRKRFDNDAPRSAKPFGEKRRFNDKPASSDRPRKSFDRDAPRKRFDNDAPRSAKPFGEKRRFNDKPTNTSDKPRKRFDRDNTKSAAPKRRESSVFERPTYEFENRGDNPKVLYKKRVETKSRTDKPASRSIKTGGKFTKKPFRDSKRGSK